MLGWLIFEHRLRLGQADFLGRSADAHAPIVDRYEQTAGQLFPGPHAVRVAAGAEGDIELGVLLDQVPQGSYARIRLAGAGIEERVQGVRRPDAKLVAPAAPPVLASCDGPACHARSGNDR